MVKKIIGAALFSFIIFLFCYFRLKPLYFQTVGYTYDQGRDFLKAAEIIRDKNITFIGPTTGIQGLFHGAWYYYLLTIPFLIFKGLPVGYYYFNFLIQFVSFLVFCYFLTRYFGSTVSLIISFLLATSPYFVFTSTFIGNNIFVLPFFLAFLIFNFLLIEQKIKPTNKLLIIGGFILGLITEFELAFGFFLIPSFFLLILLLKTLRIIFFQKKNSLLFLIGLMIAFLPRIFFELKNNFIQTHSFLTYLSTPNIQTSKSFSQILQERFNLFYGYFNSLFLNDLSLKIFVIFLFIFIYLFFESKIKKHRRSLSFFTLLLLLLFLLSSLVKINFFWGNYFEGVQYLLLFLLALTISIQTKFNSYIFNLTLKVVLVLVIIISFNNLLVDLKAKPNITGTLKQHLQIVDYVLLNGKDQKDFCLKIYTPPVIPYTYNYLFLYNSILKDVPLPKSESVGGRCWYIIEPDDNNERRTEWLVKNIPLKANVIMKKVFNEIEVALYKLD